VDSGVRIGALFCAAAAAGAVVLFSPNPPTASALPGSFTYTNGKGQTVTSSRPPSGSCVSLVGSGPVKNMVEAKVSLYRSPTDGKENCGSLRDRVAEIDGMTTENDVPTFQWARWDA
jgi:hypothetical protein